MAEKKSVKKIAEKEDSKNLGISGFTLSILSIILIGWYGLIISIISFTFCYIQQKKNPIKMGKIGIILSIIGFILSLIFIIVYAIYLYPLIQKKIMKDQ